MNGGPSPSNLVRLAPREAARLKNPPYPGRLPRLDRPAARRRLCPSHEAACRIAAGRAERGEEELTPAQIEELGGILRRVADKVLAARQRGEDGRG